MSRLSFACLASLALAVLIVGSFVVDSPVYAQAAVGQAVNNIVTADGVKIKGTFYGSAQVNAPTVIMLHPIGEDKSSKSPEWKNLAEAMAKAGYAVLMFDFRGHGESTSIDDPKTFWAKQINFTNVKSKDKEAIDVRDYIRNGTTYLPVLVNDIAAARAWLDRRNDDSKDCNTANLMIVAADQGATLGAIWMNAEWNRYKYTPDPFLKFVVPNPKYVDSRPEGKDIIAAVFLTPQPKLQNRDVSLSKLLKVASYDNGTAIAIFHGKDDAKATAYAKSLANAIKPKKDSRKHAFTDAVELNTKLSGVKLLQKGLGTERAIVDYLGSVKDERASDRSDHEFLTNSYVWRSPLNSQLLIPAKHGKKGEKNLNFDDYSRFSQ
jgi:hypothetical protein